MEINEENSNPLANGRKVMKLWIITLQFQLKKKQTNQPTNKQNNLITLTFSREKRSCLIRRKKKKIIVIIIKRGMRIEKEIKKLIKMAMEAIILMIS